MPSGNKPFTWTNVDQDLYCHMASPSHNEWNNTTKWQKLLIKETIFSGLHLWCPLAVIISTSYWLLVIFSKSLTAMDWYIILHYDYWYVPIKLLQFCRGTRSSTHGNLNKMAAVLRRILLDIFYYWKCWHCGWNLHQLTISQHWFN